MPLTEKEKKTLLRIAREAIAGRLAGAEVPLSAPDAEPPGLMETRGAFVSLHKAGRLRGCIGVFVSERPLSRTVGEMAISAATADPRFAPVTKGELSGLTIEVSALTPLRKIEDVREIEVGRHGIYITSGQYRGVLLPQVAVEHGFDRETFLDQTCVKAGLSPGCWKEKGVDIHVFEAEIFSEKE